MEIEIVANSSTHGMTLRHTLQGQHEQNIWKIA